MNTVKTIFLHRHALRLLIERELSGRHKGTMMGFFWLILQPLIMVIVYSFVFSVIMKVRIPGMDNSYHFALYLMAAMMPFTAFQDAVTAASNSLFVNASLLHKSTLPAIIIPLVSMLATVVTEAIALVIIVIAAYFLLEQVSYYLLMLPFLVFVRLIFSLSIGFFISILSVFVQDIRQALGILITMLLFLTPVFYPVSMIPENFVAFNEVNPMFHLLDAYRAVIIRGEMPDVGLYYVLGGLLVFLMISIVFYQKTIERAKEFV